MALITTPTTIGFESIEFRAVNATAISMSPFTYKQQVFAHAGQRWEASVTIPSVRKDLAAPWTAFLLRCRGPENTFLLGDPDYTDPQGTLRSTTAIPTASLTGDINATTASIAFVTQTDTLKAGDYVQVGLGSSARLYKILEDCQGDSAVEVWPKLRDTYAEALIKTDSPKGVFRLRDPASSWSINNQSSYNISFEVVEAITG
tara:strand:- start:9085 stop:9693 length:609 start_codon:yes stop_codon:yes gene_type:complete